MVREFVLMSLIPTVGLLISGCDDPEPSRVGTGNFEAEVSGAVTGRVLGPGLARFLPPSEANFGSIPGYFFVADGAGVRELGITFTIPANTEPGVYRLESAPPMEVGTAFEVRVDRSVGNRTESFEANTEGTIRLDAFPEDGSSLEGHPIRGSFDFSTQDRTGREVTVRGSFEFRAGEARSRT